MRIPSPPAPVLPEPAHHAACASWIELDARALRRNVATFRALASAGPHSDGPRSLGVVLKGNAYGHGFEQLLPEVHPIVDALFVISPIDALAVRRFERAQSKEPRQVVVLGAIGPEEAVLLAQAGIDAVVADASWARFLPILRAAGLPRPLRVHVHVDTGLGREGFTLAQLPTDAAFLAEAADVLEVVGVLSHFSNTEDVTEQAYARHQLAHFDEGVAKLEALLPHHPRLQRHFAASAPSMVLPEARHDCLRVGIGLYGLWPSTETRLSARMVLGHLPELEPVLSWRVKSQLVKWLEPGDFVGYGCTWRAEERTRVAVLPVGYFDGYPRLLSSRAHALVNGRRCPVLGRVMMNHIVIDVTRAATDDAPVVATLLGQDGEAQLTAETLASWAETINYELVTRLGAHLERRIV